MPSEVFSWFAHTEETSRSGRGQALSTALEMNNISSMTDINLEGEQIGDPGAEAWLMDLMGSNLVGV